MASDQAGGKGGTVVATGGGRKEPTGIVKEERGLTGARGVASLYVFSYHALALYWVYLGIPVAATTVLYFSPYSFLISGCGIDFFFVLTAYLLTKKMTRGDYPSLRYYFTKRIFRIWPLFYVTLIPVALLGLYQPSWLTLLFASNYLPNTFSNTPLWTLMVEELFYVLLPLWIRLFIKGRMKYTIPILLLVTVVYRVLSPADNIEFFDKQIPSYLFDYALGTALGLGVNVKLGKWKYPFLALFGVYASFFPNGYAWFSHVPYALFYYLIIGNFANSSLLSNRVSIYLGKISYPFSLFGTFVMTRLDGDLFAGMFNIQVAYQAYEWGVLSLGVSLVLAIVAHRVVEKSGIALGRRVITRFNLASRPKKQTGTASGLDFGPLPLLEGVG